MRIARYEFEHPTQVSRLAVNVFEQEVGKDVPAAEDALRGQKGFIVTEERVAATNVYKTLGFYPTREEALARADAYAAELAGHRWTRRVAATA